MEFASSTCGTEILLAKTCIQRPFTQMVLKIMTSKAMRMEETSKQIWNLLSFLDDSQDPEVDWTTGFVSRKEETVN